MIPTKVAVAGSKASIDIDASGNLSMKAQKRTLAEIKDLAHWLELDLGQAGFTNLATV